MSTKEQAPATAIVETENALPVAAPQSESASFLAMIERVVRDPSIDVAKMEHLLNLQERVMERQAKMAFDRELALMQPDLPQVDRKGNIIIREKGGEKIIQSTPYALWEDINTAIGPHLREHGFALSFRTGQAADGKLTVTGVLSHRDGHREETTITLMHDSSGSKNSVQAVGSSISYGKRYTAGMLLNITSRAPGDADDDGKRAGDPQPISEEQLAELRSLFMQIGGDIASHEKRTADYFKVSALAELPRGQFERARKAIAAKVGAKK